MRKQIFSLALSTAFGLGIAMAAPQATAPAQSQDQSTAPQHGQWAGRHEADPNKELQRMTKKLNLTSDQQNQILPILTNRQQQMESIRNDSSLSAQDRRAKFRSVREDSDTKIRAVLNDDQKKQYDQMQQQMRERHQGHEQNNGTGSGS
jgi:periplasmic protein CpxP/Spy